jgi:hypothetical protein
MVATHLHVNILLTFRMLDLDRVSFRSVYGQRLLFSSKGQEAKVKGARYFASVATEHAWYK